MAIATAIQRGSRVYVYDDRKHELYNKSGELHIVVSVAEILHRFDGVGIIRLINDIKT